MTLRQGNIYFIPFLKQPISFATARFQIITKEYGLEILGQILGAKVTGHRQEQLTQTLILRLLKARLH